jgi:ribose/xylose/arabinose/galactoside ABC-type transport system permease subunit
VKHTVATTSAPAPRHFRLRLGWSDLGLVAFYLVVLTFFIATTPTFRTRANLVEILSDYSYVAIMAVGMAFPILLAGIDLSVGAIVGLVGMVAFDQMVVIGHIPGPIAVVVCLVVGVLCGLANGALIVYLRLNPFIATLATLATYRGLNWLISGRQSNWLTHLFVSDPSARESLATTAIGNSFFLGISGSIDGIPWIGTVPNAFVYLVVIAVAAWFILKRTTLGRNLYAVGGNERAARLAGINVNRVKLFAYAVSGLCSAVAALVLVSAQQTSQEDLGTGFELSAIAAAVIGGVSLAGGVGGSFGPALGAFLIATIYIGLQLKNVETYWQGIAVGAVLIIAIAYDRFVKVRAERAARRRAHESEVAEAAPV